MQFLTLLDEVLEQRERDGVRGIDRERSRARCHIRTAKFALDDVASIGSPAIREWLREMSQKLALGPGDERKLSRQTVCRSQSLVSTVFQEALERELIEVNPCSGVKPKKRVDESDTRVKWAYLSVDEQAAIDTCEGIPRADRLAILIAIDTGMRQGEQRHLRLEDVELDGPSPCIQIRVAGRTKDGRVLPPKSGKPRTVPLLPAGVAHFREWLAMLPTFAPSNPHGIVFTTASGTYRQQGKPLGRSDTFRRFLALAGVSRRVRWHDLRHTYATNGIVLYGWRIEIVQGLMGHSSVTVTQRYSHIGEDALKSQIRKTAAELAAAAGPVLAEGPDLVRQHAAKRGLIKRVLGRFFGGPKEGDAHAVA
jgi:integrase